MDKKHQSTRYFFGVPKLAPRRSTRGRLGPAASALIALSWLAACSSDGNAEAADDTITFAVSDIQGLEELQREFKPFQADLEQILGVKVELFPVPSLNAAVAAMESGDIDIMLTGPSEYVVLHARGIADTLLGIQRVGYHSVIYNCSGAKADELSDLRGQAVVMNSPGGTSSHLGPSKLLQDAGIDPSTDIDLNLVMDDGTAGAACAAGDVAARGSSEAAYDTMLEETGVPREDVPIIAEGPDFPPDLFAISHDVPEERVEELKATFVENKEAILDSIVGSGSSENYYANAYADAEVVEISDEDYDYMREAFAAIGASDLTEFPG